VGHEPSEIAREALLRDRLEVRLRRREQRHPDQEGHQQARVALASYLRLGANAQRALERPSREREEERHVELMDEPHEEVEARRGVGTLQVPRLVVERPGCMKREQQERGADAQPVDVLAPRQRAGGHWTSLRAHRRRTRKAVPP
jgi:hypothetical protein